MLIYAVIVQHWVTEITLTLILSRQGRGNSETPSPLAGEGWDEGEILRIPEL